jgi:hypothetical protein
MLDGTTTAMLRATIMTAAVLAAAQTYAADSYTALSQAVVMATVSSDLVYTSKTDRKAFAKCFRAQGLMRTTLRPPSRPVKRGRASSVV